MVRTKKAERETIITRSEDQSDWHVFSEDKRVIKKLTKLFGEGTKQGAAGKVWTLPATSLSFRKPTRRKLSDEERKAVAERLKKGRKAKSKKKGARHKRDNV